mgnify:CR=1 FL=1
MAIEFYSSIDLNKNELQNAVVANAISDPSGGVEGQIYYNSNDNQLKVHDGSNFVNISGDITAVTAGDGLTGGGTTGALTLNVVGGNGITANADDIAITAAQTTITSILNSSLVVGRDAHNQIKFSTDDQIIFRVGNADGVTFKASGEIEATKFDGDLEGNADTATALETARNFTTTGDVVIASTSFDGSSNFTAAATIQSTAVEGSMLNDNVISGQTDIGADIESTDEILISDNGSLRRSDVSRLTSFMQSALTFTNNTDVDVSVANLKTRLAGGFSSNAVTIGDSNDVVTIGNDLIVTGDLTIQGDTVTANVGTLDVEDKNITLNRKSGQDTSSTADGAGITIQNAVSSDVNATLLWNQGSSKFVFSHLIDAPGTSIFESLDISGNVDIDGSLETDALSLNGTTVSATAAELNVLDGFAGVTADLTYAKDLRATGVTTTEFDKLDGLTATTSELNIMDGVTATTSELNIMDGVTATTSELNILDGVTATADELNVIDGNTSATSTTIVDADRVVVNDNGTMKQVTVAQMSTYYQAEHAAARMVVADIDVSSLTDDLRATITHNLGTADVMVQLYDKTTEATVYADIGRTTDDFNTASTSVITVDFGTTPPNDIRCVITSLANATAGSVAYT